MKPRIAFFDFACCEGCQLTVLELEEKLIDLLRHAEVVEWREAMTGTADAYDIAFCEGSITRKGDVKRIRKIRATAETLVALGSCAAIGCHNALKNRWPMEEVLNVVYGKASSHFDTIPAHPIASVVGVDYEILGCPASLPEIERVIKSILTGQEDPLPHQPVCVECKLNDTLCVFEKGEVCLGPVTRCGCNAICTAYGDACHGCRGLMDGANLMAAVKVLTADRLHPIMDAVARRYGVGPEEIRSWFTLYNTPQLQLEKEPEAE
jgi:sulfhydrogenase subunit delta